VCVPTFSFRPHEKTPKISRQKTLIPIFHLSLEIKSE
jgi:hypothetical protein